MNVVIVHYHLNRGGVTQVIINQLQALSSIAEELDVQRVYIVFGGRKTGWPDDLLEKAVTVPVDLVEVPSLDYDEANAAGSSDLVPDALSAIERLGLSADTTLMHLHNHALGKNVRLPALVTELARREYRMLLQIHDFAEDFRPSNYRHLATGLADGDLDRLPTLLYPQSANIHYAAINGRDISILQSAGVDPSRLHYLPNPVGMRRVDVDRRLVRSKFADRFDVSQSRRFVLYPVRGIRRKNVGELLLWAALDPESTYGITLPPLNPAEIPRHDQWRSLATELNLGTVFDLGSGDSSLSFHENLAAADALITTSVAEGFGMVFLESWIVDRPLVGRDLPDITSDFVDAGMSLPWMSPRLCVPLDWIHDSDGLREMMLQQINSTLRAYQQPEIVSERMRALFDQKTEDGQIDFASLDVPRQADIIRIISREPDRGDVIRNLNSWMWQACTVNAATGATVVQANQSCVQQSYSLEVAGARLWDVYQQVARSAVETDIAPLANGRAILDRLLDPARLHLIRLNK